MLVLFLLCAFRSGSDRFYLRRAEGFDPDGKEVFFYFRPKNALSLAAFYLNLFGRRFLILLICFLPFAAVWGAFIACLGRGGLSLNVSRVLLVASALLFLNGVFYFIRFNGFFFLARYYFASGRYFSFRQLFRFSYKCIREKKLTVLKKRISFIGWFASCAFLLPVSFVRSYYNRSMAQLARDLMGL